MWIDDDVLKRCDQDLAVQQWVPQSLMVVLGSSNRAEIEVHEDSCERMNVPVLKRYGGGGTVVLYPGCLVISVGAWVGRWFENALYFRLLNQAVIDALSCRWPLLQDLGQRGHSDIVWREQKVGGTSLFRSRNYLLYQASLLIHADFDLIDQVLAHPSKEPDYRQGRRHREFLTDLRTALHASELTAGDVLVHMETHLQETIRQRLGSELVSSFPDQVSHLLKRVASAGGTL